MNQRLNDFIQSNPDTLEQESTVPSASTPVVDESQINDYPPTRVHKKFGKVNNI